jgi:hypothetical protein
MWSPRLPRESDATELIGRVQVAAKAGLSAAEKAEIFNGTAARVYKLGGAKLGGAKI